MGKRKKLALDARDETGAFVSKRCVKLNKGRTGTNLCVSIRARTDATDADKNELLPHALAHRLQYRRGGREQRRAGKTACLILISAFHIRRAGQRGVGDDQAFDAGGEAHGRDVVHRRAVEIGRDLEQQRRFQI